jgi:quinolinate synthase
MIRHVGTYTEPTTFLVATEPNMMWQLEQRFPRHTYLGVPGITCACNKCPHMARNTLEKVRDCMKNLSPEITWQPEFDRAREVLQRSLLQAAPAKKPAPALVDGD